VDLDAVPKNRVPDWIEGHEHAPDELVVVEEDAHSRESGGRGKAHGDRCRPAQGGADGQPGAEQQGRGSSGLVLLDGASRRGDDGREQDRQGAGGDGWPKKGHRATGTLVLPN
jgi:hypothetical protein